MRRLIPVIVALVGAVPAAPLPAAEAERPVARTYAPAPPAPKSQSWAEADAKSAGCQSCHRATDHRTMHASPAVVLGCTDCHGGNAAVHAEAGAQPGTRAFLATLERAHVLPRYPKAWNWPSSANPKRTYALLNREAPEFVRFVNPSDYRAARAACGACHLPIIEAAERSLMATGAMLWGGAAYNNGILPFKRYLLGEAYTPDGRPARIVSPGPLTEAARRRGVLEALYPLPTWHVVPPADVFRVFERGGRNINTNFPEVGLPNVLGQIQRLEEPGRPDIRQSNRGPGTGQRVAIPVLNIHKTRLNDPFTWFMGTNDQPGDYRHSGCAACHVVYANDREPRHSLSFARHGRDGETATADPMIPRGESGHPIAHAFTRAIPTSQCMNCHMHQPNIFLNSYLGYTMWDYEADAPAMWPEKQAYPDAAAMRKVLDRNPEGAAVRGRWADLDFLRNVYDLNPKLQHTQFADYHGHGWNFRAILKRDREGHLLDAEGNRVDPADPERWRRAGEGKFVPAGVNPGKTVHLMDIHAEVGMQCADCHFAQDSHGTGNIHGEVADAVEIACRDCHGTADAYPTLRTSNVAARPGGTDLSLLRNPDGQRRFEWVVEDGRRVLLQRSIVDPGLVWRVSLVKDSVDPAAPGFNLKAARAKLMARSGAETGRYLFGPGVAPSERAHRDEAMTCYTCHLAWTTSCGGCHLPIEANWKTQVHRYEGKTTRNWASYNPQVARDEMFQLGIHQTSKGNVIAPVRSSSALVLTSTNANRERIYVQQPPISAIGFSSQAFAPHFPHTVRKTETKTCTDCHLSSADDNNAWMAQLLLQGTNYVNFVGLYAYAGGEGGISAIRVTEFSEPQAVLGSYLHRYAYPDYYRWFVERQGRELKTARRGRAVMGSFWNARDSAEEFRNIDKGTAGAVGCLQHRGEWLFAAEAKAGLRVYDIASVANKGVSEPILTGPFSRLGHDTLVPSRHATCVALPTNQPVAPTRNTPEMRELNAEQPFHPIYHYAAVSDAEEGLILVNVDTLVDREPRNNRLRRAVTWNPGGLLRGARHVMLAGSIAYVAADAGLVVVDLSDPLSPRHAATVPLPEVRASALQFRYLFATTARGLEVLDATDLRNPRPVPGAVVPLPDARRVYVARTYAYVAAGRDGLVIVNATNPERPRVHMAVTLDGRMDDASDVIVASTNASAFAYVADGRNGLKVLQLTSPDSQPNFYGFAPAPVPELIAFARTPWPLRAVSKGLDRDRAVDETGGQIAVFGRYGSRPFTAEEMRRFYLNREGRVWKVSDRADMADWVGPRPPLRVAGR
ncbi:hypothetical protein [Thermaurantiacus tibetensis]|uniref:hypothetical protein n=1 Tax=Thermaurantiacus tibetensis TaxID=2759035 RepID=UPI00188F5F0A|nr:hypothetical protein [Thermaurantiacus tibetensis]